MPEQFTEKEVREGKFFAVISYVGILCIIALILKKDNRFALYHARQGLVLFVLEVAAVIISIIPLLGWLLGNIGMLAAIIASVWGIILSLRGEASKIPVVSELAGKIVL